MKKDILEIGGNTLMYILTAEQTQYVFQIISLILSIIISILIIIGKIVTWYKRAKQDGKIDEDEIKEGIDIITDGVKEIKDDVTKKDKE